MLGNTTGSFDQDGEFVEYSGSNGLATMPNLKFPRFQLGYATHIGRGVSVHAGVGASQTIYSASFTPLDDVQDYDLQSIVYSASLDSSSPFHNKISGNAITIMRVYYKTPRS